MTAVEQPCYTLINVATDTEPYNEMQLKLDLGMLHAILDPPFYCRARCRERQRQTKSRSSEKNNSHDFGRRTSASGSPDDDNPLRPSLTRPHGQKTVVDLLGDRPEDQPRR
jgi:hypothetical protein